MNNIYRHHAKQNQTRNNDYTLIILNDKGTDEDIDITYDRVHWFHLTGRKAKRVFLYTPIKARLTHYCKLGRYRKIS
jgi:hypothetical protein